MIDMKHLRCGECGISNFKVIHTQPNDRRKRTIQCKTCLQKYDTFTPDYGIIEIKGIHKSMPQRKRKNLPKEHHLRDLHQDLSECTGVVINLKEEDIDEQKDLETIANFFNKFMEV